MGMDFARALRLLCLFVFVLPVSAFCSGPVVDWNAEMLKDLVAAKIDLLKQERICAITQIAMYEAANAAHPTYERSAIAVPDAPGASVPAAIDEAAYQSLVVLAPEVKADLEKERARQMAFIPESPEKAAGIKVGAAAAAAVLKWRQNDGADYSTAYTPGSGDGAYLPTSDNPMAGPVSARMRPFGFDSSAAFRPPPAPPLDSPQMRRDLEELVVWGGKTSTLRTPEETEIARFHAQPGVYAWNSIARQTVAHLSLGDVESARLMALVDVAIVDSHSAVWDAKYAYNLWRPITALRVGAGPLHMKPIPDWTPLLSTPMIPEYPCAHCGLSAAAQVVLEGLAGDQPFELIVKSGEITRNYHSFRQFAEEDSISRIYGGVHYRWSLYVGDEMGRQVGQLELKQAAPLLAAKP